MGYGIYGRGSISGRDKDFSVFHSVQTVSVTHPASSPTGIRGFFPRGKSAKA
jgi:hypothetical protein